MVWGMGLGSGSGPNDTFFRRGERKDEGATAEAHGAPTAGGARGHREPPCSS